MGFEVHINRGRGRNETPGVPRGRYYPGQLGDEEPQNVADANCQSFWGGGTQCPGVAVAGSPLQKRAWNETVNGPLPPFIQPGTSSTGSTSTTATPVAAGNTILGFQPRTLLIVGGVAAALFLMSSGGSGK